MDALDAARDQALFREVNERLRDLNETFAELARESTFVCECANRDCLKHISLTLAEYEEVRRIPTHFAVADEPGHVFPDVERVTRVAPTYIVVEKFGRAGIEAVKLDPRSRKNVGDTPAYAAVRAEHESARAPD
jgi:hypothetical protein